MLLLGTLRGIVHGTLGVSASVLGSLRVGEAMFYIASTLFQTRLLGSLRVPGTRTARRLLHTASAPVVGRLGGKLIVPAFVASLSKAPPLRCAGYVLRFVPAFVVPGSGLVTWMALSCHLVAEGVRWQLAPLYVATGAPRLVSNLSLR